MYTIFVNGKPFLHFPTKRGATDYIKFGGFTPSSKKTLWKIDIRKIDDNTFVFGSDTIVIRKS